MFAPNRMKQLEDDLRHDPLRCGLVGGVGALALIPLVLLLVVSCVGIPLVAALAVLLPLGMAMGLCAMANEIGRRLPFFRRQKTQDTVLAVGLLVLLLVFELPVLGWIISAQVSAMALGALIRTRFGGRRQQGIPEPA
jgi:cobalamin synthase